MEKSHKHKPLQVKLIHFVLWLIEWACVCVCANIKKSLSLSLVWWNVHVKRNDMVGSVCIGCLMMDQLINNNHDLCKWITWKGKCQQCEIFIQYTHTWVIDSVRFCSYTCHRKRRAMKITLCDRTFAVFF